MSASHYLNCCTFTLILKTGRISSHLLLKFILAILPLQFNITFRVNLSKSIKRKKTSEAFSIEILLNLFEDNWRLTILNIWTYEQGISLHLSRSSISLAFFFCSFQWQIFIYSAVFIPSHFIFWWYYLKNISIYDCSLLTFGNTVEFCILVLQPPVPAKLTLVSVTFSLDCIPFSRCTILLYVNYLCMYVKIFLLLPYQSGCLFIVLFLSLIALVRNSNIMNKNSETGYPYLALDRGGKHVF